MDSLTAFFTEKAACFATGDLKAAARTLQLPATVHVGPQKMVLQSFAEVVAMLRAYRANLKVESYDTSVFTVLHRRMWSKTEFEILLRWTNKNDRGATISTLTANYTCVLQDNGTWIVRSVDILSAPKPRLAEGLPLH